MAFISISNNNSSANVNPTSTFLPVNLLDVFQDSYLRQPNDGVINSELSLEEGIKIDFSTRIFSFGDYLANGNGLSIIISDTLDKFNLNAPVIAGGVHAPSGNYLEIYVFGTRYLISLLTP